MFRILMPMVALTLSVGVFADDALVASAKATMRKAAAFYHTQVASHGGYVYHYDIELNRRWGEGEATKDQIWVQPPGTPTVGMAFLRAHQATGDQVFLDAARDAGMALAYGQLESGGWANSIDFDPRGSLVARYRRGLGKGKNNSSLDDGQTQSAIQFLVQLDQRLEFDDDVIHRVAIDALGALLEAQFPNGGFPQVWSGPVETRQVIAAGYPDYDWRTEGRIKNYWDHYTLNDNVPGYVVDALIEADQTYDDPRYAESLARLGDFLLLAQMPSPQRAWAQQYNAEMLPVWARKFEPPAIASDETQEVILTLMKIAEVTGEPGYLSPIPDALSWLKKSLLADGQLARYYELRTNRPLYMQRDGDVYSLTYDDSNLPSHYAFKIKSKIESLEKKWEIAKAGESINRTTSAKTLAKRALPIIESLDSVGRWVDTSDGSKLLGQTKLPRGQAYLSSETFSNHLTTLADYVIASGSQR